MLGDLKRGFGLALIDNGDGTYSVRAELAAGTVEIGSIDGTGTHDSAVDNKGLQRAVAALLLYCRRHATL